MELGQELGKLQIRTGARRHLAPLACGNVSRGQSVQYLLSDIQISLERHQNEFSNLEVSVATGKRTEVLTDH